MWTMTHFAVLYNRLGTIAIFDLFLHRYSIGVGVSNSLLSMLVLVSLLMPVLLLAFMCGYSVLMLASVSVLIVSVSVLVVLVLVLVLLLQSVAEIKLK